MTHKNLDAWKKSMDLVDKAYEIAKEFPKWEDFILKQQFLKSAISIPSNLAEGCGRSSDKELIRFIDISLGSLAELDTQYEIAVRQSYFSRNNDFEILHTEAGKLMIGLKRYLQNKKR